MKNTFPNITDKPNLPEIEVKWMNQWTEIKGLEKQLEMSKDKKEFTFQDGPPFATGMPHQGHILAGTIKDVVCRWKHQTDHQVERRFGWDCHGLPVEYEVNKILNVKTRKEVLSMGIDKYNEECRKIVMKYSTDWKVVVQRFGRWIDFENNYKTMNPGFMESVWHVFKTIYEKGKVQKGVKIMPYSTGINTVMSNFEANLNYKEGTTDPSIQVRFKVVGEESYLAAWTTTPWTLPSNIALAVNEDLSQLKVQNNKGEIYYIGQPRWDQVVKECKWDKKNFKILSTLTGKDLVGMRQEPLFTQFESRKEKGNFVVIPAKQVTSDSGTCIVHQAPAFGEDDFIVCKKMKLLSTETDLPCPIDEDGVFTDPVSDFKGLYVKDADPKIVDWLKKEGKLIAAGSIVHSYPFCQRSETPLLQKAHASWFINVESVKEDLLANNLKTKWVPTAVQEHRFHNWLEDARDWCFSRNRFWGNPIPIWTSDDGEEVVVVGSIRELEQLSGVSGITDIHRHFIDHITIPSSMGKGVLRRIDEVFDCWFESGCVPQGLQEYPQKMSEEEHSTKFPADFIGEGLDQTRGWFYTLMVISTILKNQPPFKNLIVNGLVLASDGKKMSKSKQNYPDPMEVANKFGADSVRLYLCNSPVVRADPLKFREEGLTGIIRDVLLPWQNSFRFFTQNANRQENLSNVVFTPLTLKECFKNNELNNYLDKWLVAASDQLLKQVHAEMDKYHLQSVVPKILQFLEDMTNWQIKLNRPRLKGDLNDNADWLKGLSTLHHANMVLSKLMAAQAPFLAEHTQQHLKLCQHQTHQEFAESVHFMMIPKPLFQGSGDLELETQVDAVLRSVNRMKDIITLVRKCREDRKLGNSQPFQKLYVLHDDQEQFSDLNNNKYQIEEDGNIKELVQLSDTTYIVQSAKPDWQKLGQKLLKKMKDAKAAISNLTSEALKEIKHQTELNPNQEFEVAGCNILGSDVVISRGCNQELLKARFPNHEIQNNNDVTVLLDLSLSDTLLQENFVRHFKSQVQKERKNKGIHIDDFIEVFQDDFDDTFVNSALKSNWEILLQTLKAPVFKLELKPSQSIVIASGLFEYENRKIKFELCVAICRLHLAQIEKDFGKHAELVCKHLISLGERKLNDLIKANTECIELNVWNNEEDGLFDTLELKQGLHFTLPKKM